MAEMSMEEGSPRWGTIPQLNVSYYVNTIFEPHNALVHASQNFLNFCMGTMFWVTSAALYYKVNPVGGSRRNGEEYFEEYINNYSELPALPHGENALVPLGNILYTRFSLFGVDNLF